MSYGITPIAVSLDKVEAAIGNRRPGGLFGLLPSPSTKLLTAIKRKFTYRFDDDEVDEEDEPTLEQALVDLVLGNDLNESYCHKYGYALELVCDHFGEMLVNSEWTAMRIEWAETVAEAMGEAGIDASAISVTNHLMFRGSPVSIPPQDDFPSIGFLRRDEIAPAAQAIDAADLSSMDDDVRTSVEQIRLWCSRCTELDCDLICFYY